MAADKTAMTFDSPRTKNRIGKTQRALSLRTATLVLLITTSDIRVTKAQRTNPNDGNRKFDPDVGRDTSLCSIPPIQKLAFVPTDDMCQPSSGLNLTDAKELAVKYAPYVFFHPLENYTMQSVDATFDDPKLGKIWLNYDSDSLYLFSDELDQEALLRTIRDPNLVMHSNKFFFTHDLEIPSDYKNGASFTEPDGKARKSQASIYYNVFETDNNTWTFNYFFYYTFNGIANMVSLSSWEGKESYRSFTLSPFGVHEGDWEGMSVMVCRSKEVSQPLAVTYQQHGWQQTTDCTAGECTFFKDTNHPVGFSALNSHATYAISTENMVYSTVSVQFFVNLQGVLIVDRTAYLAEDNTYRVFAPNDKNILLIDDPKDVDFTTNSTKFWQAFGGLWGNSTKPTILPELGVCLNDNQTKIIPCPTAEEDPIFGLVMQLMNVYPPGDDVITQAASQLGEALLPQFSQTGTGPTGPHVKKHWNQWPNPINAPLWNSIPHNTTAVGYCLRLQQIPDTGRTDIPSNTLDIMANLIGIVVLCISLVFVTILLLWYGGKKRRVVLQFDENTGEVSKPGRGTWIQIHVASFIFTFWFLVVVIGAFMFGVTLIDLLDLLEKYVQGIDWHTIGLFLVILGIIILVIDAMLCVLIWLPSQTYWDKIMQVYHYYRGEEEEAEHYKTETCNLSFKTLHTGFLVCFDFLFISLMLSVIVVVVGVGVVGFSKAFSEVCASTVGSLDGVCLSIPFYNTTQVACGEDFQEFCNLWAQNGRFTTLWGGILIIVGHFYLVGAAGASYHQQHSSMQMLDMLPKRKDYLRNIEATKSQEPRMSFKSSRSHFSDNSEG